MAHIKVIYIYINVYICYNPPRSFEVPSRLTFEEPLLQSFRDKRLCAARTSFGSPDARLKQEKNHSFHWKTVMKLSCSCLNDIRYTQCCFWSCWSFAENVATLFELPMSKEILAATLPHCCASSDTKMRLAAVLGANYMRIVLSSPVTLW